MNAIASVFVRTIHLRIRSVVDSPTFWPVEEVGMYRRQTPDVPDCATHPVVGVTAERSCQSIATGAQHRSVSNQAGVQHHIHRHHVGLIGCHPVFPRGQREPERMAAEFGLFHDDVTTSVDDDLYWMSRLTR